MHVHLYPDPPRNFEARLHDLHQEAGKIRRRLSVLRHSPEVDLDAIRNLRAETGSLFDKTLAFIGELSGKRG